MAERTRSDSPTKTCTHDGCERPLRARGLCAPHYNYEYYPDRDRSGHIERKRERNREWTRRRRALVRGVEAERVELAVVAERDGWRCALCRRKVSATYAWPDPRCASLDHIVPLSHDGPHTYANMRLTHLACNQQRGNRGGHEQLALVG